MQDPQPAILTYDISSDPFPLHANATNVNITIVATNNSAKEIPLEGFSFTFPVGTEGSQLTNAGDVIVAIAPEGLYAPVKAEIEKGIKFVYEQTISLKPRQAFTFIFNRIDVNTTTGTAEIKIMEAGATDQRIKKLYLTKFPNAWGKVTFAVEQPVIPYGGEAALTWDGPAGATYSVEFYKDKKIFKVPDNGEPAWSNKGRYPSTGTPFNLTRTTEFTLNVELEADGNTYKAQKQKVIIVADAPLPVFSNCSASKPVIEGSSPETITLNWIVANAVIVELEGGSMGVETVTGKTSFNVTTNKSTVYKLKAFTEDNRYVTYSFEIITLADFLNYHRFKREEHEPHNIHPEPDRGYKEFGNWCDMEESLLFFTNNEGRYRYKELETVYTDKWGTDIVHDKEDTIRFKWKISDGEIICDLDGGQYSDPEQFICYYPRNGYLAFKQPPTRYVRRSGTFLFKERIQRMGANELPDLTIYESDRIIKPFSL
jgi:hypothetical protein